MPVTHCICANRSFAQLRQLAQQRNLSLEQLADRTGATRGCGLCKSYVQRALATGQCAFAVDDRGKRADGAARPVLSTTSQGDVNGRG